MTKSTNRAVIGTLAVSLALAGPAAAQLPGAGLPGGLPSGLPGPDLPLPAPTVREALPRSLGESSAPAVRQLAGELTGVVAQARALIRRNPRQAEADDRGYAVVRGEVTAVGLSEQALTQALAEGFRVARRHDLEGLDLQVTVLEVPRGMKARQALRRLRRLDPAGQYDFDHIYFEAGDTAPGRGADVPASRSGEGLRIGLVDGSAAARAPALRGVRLTQRAFGPGGAKVSAHATAVASLIAGKVGAFRGAAPGAALYVADVYGPTAAGGSAVAVAQALNWLAEARVPVINISLVGPPNAVLQAAVAALIARGHLLVAAVGNDGPAAPPLYPASYPRVVAVTGVDARRRPLPEAGRARHLDFAAPGAGIVAATSDGRLAPVRGTSFATPIAAGLLAQRLPAPDPDDAAAAVDALAREAIDLGAKGPDPVFGRGLVGEGVAASQRRAGLR